MSGTIIERIRRMKFSLKNRLMIIEAVIFLIPSLTFVYIAYQKQISLDTTQMIILVAVLALIFGGLMMLRQFFDRIMMIHSVMQKAEVDEQALLDVHKDATELHEITLSFNNLMKNFQEANRELQRRVFELFSIRELTEVASKSLNLDELFTVLLEKAIAVSRAQVGAVYMVDKQNKCFILAASKGLDTKSAAGNRIEFNKSPMLRVLSEKKPVLVPESSVMKIQSEDIDNGEFKQTDFLCMPIFVREQLAAVLALCPWEGRNQSDSNDEQIIAIMISEIGFALGNAMLHKKLEKHTQSLQERTDELTRMNDELQKAIKGREKAKEELLRANEELENRVQERTIDLGKINEELQIEISERRHAEAALQRAKEAAETANIAKSRFLANMSHELLTPLNTVIGFSQILLSKNHGELNGKQVKYLQNILKNGQQLLKLITGVLQISKIEGEIMELEISEFDLREELQGLVRMIQPSADKKRINLSLDMKSKLHTIKVDREKFKNIILNLLENAVKFSPENGDVQVTMDVVDGKTIPHLFSPEAMDQTLDDQQKFVRIAVSDNGVGLKPEDKDRIFAIFEQADASLERPFDGTGLGLAVSRKLIELHNGRIWAESEGEGKGSLFTIVLPLPKDAFREGIPLSDFLN